MPARVTLGILNVLTMTSQASAVNQHLPRVSYIKAIDVWLSMCLLFVVGALLEFPVVNLLRRRATAPAVVAAKRDRFFGFNQVSSIRECIFRSCVKNSHRPLWRRLDRSDRVIQKESGDPNGGNIVFVFRGDGYVTSTSQCTLRSLRANPL